MQTILVFRTTKLECWSRKFAGIQAFARSRDWRLQTIVCTGRTILVAPLLDFWHPAGCIVESDGASTNIRPRDFGKLPAVFLDHSPELVHQGTSVVRHDSARIEREAVSGLTARQVLADFPSSRRQAEIRFRAATGHSVLEEIQNVRFAHALELVRDDSTALGAIADRTGWPSTLVLSRYVRRRTGKTLSELRRATSRA